MIIFSPEEKFIIYFSGSLRFSVFFFNFSLNRWYFRRDLRSSKIKKKMASRGQGSNEKTMSFRVCFLNLFFFLSSQLLVARPDYFFFLLATERFFCLYLMFIRWLYLIYQLVKSVQVFFFRRKVRVNVNAYYRHKILGHAN